jgi:hypothetical protein
MSHLWATRAGIESLLLLRSIAFAAFHPWRVTQKNHYLMACWGFIPFSGLAWLRSGA